MEKDLPEEPDKLKATKTATVYSRGVWDTREGDSGCIRTGRVECPIPVWKLRGDMRLHLCACEDGEAFSISLRG